ncbi:Fucose 4-O-acetylase and related acetyltransferases [Serratia quinivorans]|uniref:acyltransferase family protein n=1 Tax=Serratia quinivorans TaxID=137545 RepID=UPI00217839A8|nr:acyltransferase [Serratia quinivorans]CAI0825718.1 Fucose 4-O-acetylase and related acetyltransferases [Serratia quinivorans]CAI0911143.1 Fucose 4-O-acetylase and related acetyltransferases [Serratia quinivorans]CAI1700444.1 Fucose 4-O-acetylase and related acetyltransferases [Serratia quinivorans]CAI2085925.1 Fucose 4-O-acetylase and related acetyltransferases [Serratia quinivorans]CAI2433205.1 Fucose 4-O-acetylase and related acetyltransferases [Serratia quinivorans]
MSKKRDLSFDLLKGTLILLVIIGHVLPGSASSGLRGAIYFFHMPLFLGVTGYFIRRYFLDAGVVSILKKYKWRMIIPYLLAFVVYSAYDLYMAAKAGGISVKTLIGLGLYPYYHLWYIPAVIIFVFYTLIIYRNNILLGLFLLLSAALSIWWYCYADVMEDKYALLKFIGDKRFYYYYSFFLLGFCISDWSARIKPLFLMPIVIASGMLSYHVPNETLVDAILWYTFNASLLCMLLGMCKGLDLQKENLLVKIGQVSLPIYLWHVFPIIIVGMVLDTNSPAFYVSVVVIISILVFSFIALRGKSRFLDSYFYGERSKWYPEK